MSTMSHGPTRSGWRARLQVLDAAPEYSDRGRKRSCLKWVLFDSRSHERVG